MTKGDLADTFVLAWRGLAPQDAPAPQREYKFHPKRKWRMDFAWPNKYRAGGVYVEIDGGNRMARVVNGHPVAIGRHTTDADYHKHNAAACAGWMRLAFTSTMLNAPEECIATVLECLKTKGIER